jgi:hypothetical protein
VKLFRKPCHSWNNVEKYGTGRQATDINVVWRMRFAFRVTKATDTHSAYLIPFFHCNNGYANAPQYYFIRSLPVHLFISNGVRLCLCRNVVFMACIFHPPEDVNKYRALLWWYCRENPSIRKQIFPSITLSTTNTTYTSLGDESLLPRWEFGDLQPE